jgi:DNA-binding response OmpR family regulator
VLIVMPDQWPRALLRAALREVGYDAVGAPTLERARRVRPAESDRGPVQLVVVDQPALDGTGSEELTPLLASHGAPATILLARPTVAAPAGSWRRVLRRPLSVADVVAAVEALLPLPPASRHALE